jgi:branched-chain amino acid transport system substrate-binding protein
MWDQVPTNKKVGVLWPNGFEGDLFDKFFASEFGASGYSRAGGGGRYEPGQLNAAGFLDAFAQNDVQIITGLLSYEDFETLWREAVARQFLPPVVTISRALLFPDDVSQGLGANGANLTTEVGWSRVYPYKSSLTKATSADLAKDYLQLKGKAWVQTLGFTHALFEIAVAALTKAESLDRRAIANAIAGVKQDTIVGQIAFGARADVPKNVAHTTLAGGQWRRDGDFDLLVVANDGVARIQPQGSVIRLRDV